jgi:YqjK-like protein
MPSNREEVLLRRREQLVARSGALRGDLLAHAGRLAPQGLMLGGANRALAWVRQHPQWALGGLALLLVLRPQRLWRWSGRLLTLWQLARQAAPMMGRLAARRR